MAHELRLLSKLGHTRVEGCSCGVVHLSVGSVSIRLSSEQARDLTRALTSAQAAWSEPNTVTAAQVRDDSDDEPPDGHSQIH